LLDAADIPPRRGGSFFRKAVTAPFERDGETGSFQGLEGNEMKRHFANAAFATMRTTGAPVQAVGVSMALKPAGNDAADRRVFVLFELVTPTNLKNHQAGN